MTTRMSLTIPDDLKSKLQAIANAERRSLSAQIVVLLERAAEAAGK